MNRKPGWYPHATRRSSYRKVLFALAMTCDEGGYWTDATNEQIAAKSGLSVSTVQAYIREMEYDGTIVTFYPDKREIVFADHPFGRAYIVKQYHAGGNIGMNCYEGDGPIATGQWPKCRIVRNLSGLVHGQ